MSHRSIIGCAHNEYVRADGRCDNWQVPIVDEHVLAIESPPRQRVFGQEGIIGKRGEKKEEKLYYGEHRLLRDLTSASRIVNAKREGENEGENVSE